MKKWQIHAQAFDSRTGNPTGSIRVEQVTADGKLFPLDANASEVKKVYESFWNHKTSQEQIKVRMVLPVRVDDYQVQDGIIRYESKQKSLKFGKKVAPAKGTDAQRIKPSAKRRLARRAEARKQATITVRGI